MSERLYTDLARWWPLLSPAEDFDEAAAAYLELLHQPLVGPMTSMLELGAGGGSIASHLPPELTVVLTDASQAMLDVSKVLNPKREHVCADMRIMRLQRQFDSVLLHDAVMYLTSPEDLRAAFDTAYAHCRPGGSFLVVPDVVSEGFVETTLTGGNVEPDGRGAQMLEWHWDPERADHTYRAEFVFLLREADGTVRSVHDRHLMGLFPRQMFVDTLRAAGFVPTSAILTTPIDGEIFLARRPS
mgnify:CR=1 FL=1